MPEQTTIRFECRLPYEHLKPPEDQIRLEQFLRVAIEYFKPLAGYKMSVEESKYLHWHPWPVRCRVIRIERILPAEDDRHVILLQQTINVCPHCFRGWRPEEWKTRVKKK